MVFTTDDKEETSLGPTVVCSALDNNDHRNINRRYKPRERNPNRSPCNRKSFTNVNVYLSSFTRQVFTI